MIWTVIAILLILWLVAIVTSYTMSGLAHLLLVIVVILIVWRLLSGSKPL